MVGMVRNPAKPLNWLIVTGTLEIQLERLVVVVLVKVRLATRAYLEKAPSKGFLSGKSLPARAARP